MRDVMSGRVAFSVQHVWRRRVPSWIARAERLGERVHVRHVRARFEGEPVEVRVAVHARELAESLSRALSAGTDPEEAPTSVAWIRSVPRGADGGGLFVPSFVAPRLTLGPDESAWLRSRDARRKVKRAEAMGYEVELTREPSALEELHDTMYAPSMRARHGDEAFLRSRAYLAAGLRRGSLLFLRRDGRRIAGALNVRHGVERGVLEHWAGGVRDADVGLVEEGADVALLWESARLAAREGYGALGLTQARPFLTNGLTAFKARFATELTAEDIWSHHLELRAQAMCPALAFAVHALGPLVGRDALVALTWRRASKIPRSVASEVALDALPYGAPWHEVRRWVQLP